MTETLTWPTNSKCAVLLTFNVDGPASWYVENRAIWKMPKTFGMAAYGPWRGLPRLLGALERHDVPGTFFVPSWTAETWPDQFAAILEGGHEVGHRGYLLENNFDSSLDEFDASIARSHAIFERLGAPPAKGYRADNGNLRLNTGATLSQSGYLYSSSLRGDDRPYMWEYEGEQVPLVELPLHTELDDSPQFVFSFNPPMPRGQDRIASVEATFSNWEMEFTGYYEEGLLYVLTLDPQYIGTPGRMARFEAFLGFLRSHKDVWFARGAEVASWYSAQRARGEVKP